MIYTCSDESIICSSLHLERNLVYHIVTFKSNWYGPYQNEKNENAATVTSCKDLWILLFIMVFLRKSKIKFKEILLGPNFQFLVIWKMFVYAWGRKVVGSSSSFEVCTVVSK